MTVNVLVIGAAGGIGRNVVAQALEAGHRVTAFVRDPSKLALDHPNLITVRGDVLDARTLGAAVDGRDIVVSTIGVTSLKATTLYSEGTRNIVAAMAQSGVRRFIGISASGLHADENDAPLLRYIAKPIVAWVLRESYTDIARMETIVRASGLDWTILVPPRLTNGPRTGAYRTEIGRNVRHGGMTISRADCADYIVGQLGPSAGAAGLAFIAH